MIKRIWAFVTRGRLVWLKDFDGEITLTIARRDPWGELTAKRHWPFSIHNVVLEDNGEIAQHIGEYVKSWKWA